ncbi:MAG: Ig-like domain-containing protein, partial [Candidatus Kariarchaeaceae archaeon]
FTSVGDSYSWFLQSNSSGMIIITLPQQPITGEYTLTATYSGNTDYLATSSASDILVVGVDTVLEWIVEPIDGYYGESIMFSIHAEDSFGSNLQGFVIEVMIGNDLYSSMTNSAGLGTFSIPIYLEGQVLIDVYLQPQAGWNSQNISSNVNIVKKQLIVYSEINSKLYSPINGIQSLDFAILVNSSNDPWLENIKVELYWLNPVSSEFEYLDFYYTNGIGYIYSTISLPSIDASLSYLFRWSASDSHFLPSQIDKFYSITPMPLDISVQYNSGLYNSYIPIYYVIKDLNGNLLNNIIVTASYSDVVLLWSQTGSTSFGALELTFTPPSVGDLWIYYTVLDSRGNYLFTENSFLISVVKSDININYSFEDTNGIVLSNLEVRDPNLNIVNEGIIVLEKWDGSWNIVNTINLAQINTIELDIDGDTTLFRLNYLENDHYNSISLDFDLFLQDISLVHDDFIMKASNGLDLYLQLLGNSTFNGYSVDVSILDNINYEWVDHGSMFTVEGIINSTIPINLSVGQYQIRFIISQQGWFHEYNQTFLLTILYDQFEFEVLGNELIQGMNNDVMVQINVSRADAVNNVRLDLFLDDGTNQVHLGFAFTDINGIAVFHILPNQSYGVYNMIIESEETEYVERSLYEFTASIGFSVEMNSYIIGDITYDLGGLLIIELTDHHSNPIRNTQIEIFYSLYNSINQSYSDRIYLMTGITNSSGFIEIRLESSILDSENIRLSIAVDSTLIIGENSFDVSLDISKSQPNFNLEYVDYGTTQYAEFTIVVFNNNVEEISGQINWKLIGASFNVILNGTTNLSENQGKISAKIIIPANFIGEYTLIIDYHDNNDLSKYLD